MGWIGSRMPAAFIVFFYPDLFYRKTRPKKKAAFYG